MIELKHSGASRNDREALLAMAQASVGVLGASLVHVTLQHGEVHVMVDGFNVASFYGARVELKAYSEEKAKP